MTPDTTGASAPTSASKRMHKAKHIIIGIVAILAIVVILQNTASVETRFLFFKMEMPRAVLLFLALAVGFFLGLLFSFTTAPRKDAPS